MSWKLDKNGVTPNVPLTHAEQAHLNTFMNNVRQGISPSRAASSWDSDYKCLDTKKHLWQFRLSQNRRVTFIIVGETVKITYVGKHK